MADNTRINSVDGIEAIVTDELGDGSKVAATKVLLGGDGVNGGYVSTSNPFPVVDAGIGGLTETAPASDTASSGLNGRLQRIAQRISSLIALLPAALTGSGNLKVAVVESTASQPVTGTFWQATQPVSGTVAVSNVVLPSRVVSGVVDDGSGNALTVKTAAGSASSSGVNNAITAVPTKRIRVIGYSLQAANANGTSIVAANWQDDAGTPVVLSQTWDLAAREGVSKPLSGGPGFYFQTTAGQALKLNLGSALAVRWEIAYVEA